MKEGGFSDRPNYYVESYPGAMNNGFTSGDLITAYVRLRYRGFGGSSNRVRLQPERDNWTAQLNYVLRSNRRAVVFLLRRAQVLSFN